MSIIIYFIANSSVTQMDVLFFFELINRDIE